MAAPHPPVRQICCVDGQPDSHVSPLDGLEHPQVELYLDDMLVETLFPRRLRPKPRAELQVPVADELAGVWIIFRIEATLLEALRDELEFVVRDWKKSESE